VCLMIGWFVNTGGGRVHPPYFGRFLWGFFMLPRRIQLLRAKGWRMPENTVKVDRTTKWGNPYRVGESYAHPTKKSRVLIESKDQSVAVFKEFLKTDAGKKMAERARIELRGKNLACWCRVGELCHGDLLLAVANRAAV